MSPINLYLSGFFSRTCNCDRILVAVPEMAVDLFPTSYANAYSNACYAIMYVVVDTVCHP